MSVEWIRRRCATEVEAQSWELRVWGSLRLPSPLIYGTFQPLSTSSSSYFVIQTKLEKPFGAHFLNLNDFFVLPEFSTRSTWRGLSFAIYCRVVRPRWLIIISLVYSRATGAAVGNKDVNWTRWDVLSESKTRPICVIQIWQWLS